MGEKMDTGQFRRFAAALDAESTRPELTAWKTTFTAAAMSIRQLADHVDFHITQPAQAVNALELLAAEYELTGNWAIANGLRANGVGKNAYDYEVAIRAVARALTTALPNANGKEG